MALPPGLDDPSTTQWLWCAWCLTGACYDEAGLPGHVSVPHRKEAVTIMAGDALCADCAGHAADHPQHAAPGRHAQITTDRPST